MKCDTIKGYIYEGFMNLSEIANNKVKDSIVTENKEGLFGRTRF